MQILGLKVGGGPYPVWLDVLALIAWAILGLGVLLCILEVVFDALGLTEVRGVGFMFGVMLIILWFFLGAFCAGCGIAYQRRGHA